MKKVIILCAFILFVSGCDKKEVLTCTLENTKATITIKNGEVIDINALAEFDDKELTENMCPIIKTTVTDKNDVTCGDTEITIKNYQNSIEVDNLEKDTVLKYFLEQGYSCK